MTIEVERWVAVPGDPADAGPEHRGSSHGAGPALGGGSA
jgi:hypothetical protein